MTRKLVFSILFPHGLAILFVIFFPGKAIIEDYLFLFLSSALFISIVLLLGFLTYSYLLSHRIKLSSSSGNHNVDVRWVRINSWALLVASFLGATFLVYDRIFIRNINYFDQELRAARYEWVASDGGGLLSVTGNLLIPFSYIGVFFSIRYFKYIKIKYLLLVVSIFVIFVHAYLNGGRSNIFLLLVFLYVLYCVGDYKISIGFIRRRFFIPVLLFCVIVSYYIFAVVKSSASIGDVSIQKLLYLGILDMYGIPDAAFFKDIHSDFLCFLLYSLLYLFHGQWTSQIVYSLTERSGYHSIVSAPTVILDSLGLIDLGLYERAFSDTGAFVSLPASVYYDFGWFGLVICSALLGVLFGLVLFYVNKYKHLGFLGSGLLFFTMPILILSPILPAYGFGYYSFVLFSVFLFFIINMVFCRRKIYL